MLIKFGSNKAVDDAYTLLRRQFAELELSRSKDSILGRLLPASLSTMRQSIVEQTMTTLRNRVNELGIAEAIVQQQGGNRITVELPVFSTVLAQNKY